MSVGYLYIQGKSLGGVGSYCEITLKDPHTRIKPLALASGHGYDY
jgi:hypothetical protein